MSATACALGGFNADDEVGATCATGTGAGFIRLVLSRQVRDMMSRGASSQEAAEVA